MDEEQTAMVFITGDTHGRMGRLSSFLSRMKPAKDDIMIILGDVGLNYYGSPRDDKTKEELAGWPNIFFCIHGNHEMRPAAIKRYRLLEWHGGQVWVEDRYPNILFAKDGEIYDIAGKQCIVIGGAYSVDKYYRLRMGYPWFEDEQPSDEIKAYVESQLKKRDWKIDIVLSHTVPWQYMPTDMFISGIDQSSVDQSTEEWLRDIESKLSYEWWYAGHYHTSRIVDKVQIMFEEIEEFKGGR